MRPRGGRVRKLSQCPALTCILRGAAGRPEAPVLRSARSIPPMTSIFPIHGSRRLRLSAFAATLVGCQAGTDGARVSSGTATPSPCKHEEAYANYAATITRSASALAQSIRGGHATLESALIGEREVPVTLECLEWEFQAEQLSIRISNFAGPCGAEWVGATFLKAPGAVSIELDTCTAARCGSCTYDTAAELTAPLAEIVAPTDSEVAITLALGDCDGIATSEREWQVPLSSQPTGISCKPAVPGLNGFPDSDYFSETQRNLYAVCDAARAPVAVECTEARSCVDGFCLEPCTEDRDCPLDGALVCRDGACKLPS